ncbi:MAG: DUF2796 domain-containing protein [Pseudomonadota bacterium]
MSKTIALLLLGTALGAAPAYAGENHNHDHDHNHAKRSVDAHEHGVSTLEIAIEGKTVAMRLEAPGADIVGFEYKAKTKADKTKIRNAMATLREPLALFKMPAAAGCKVAKVEVALEGDDVASEDHAGHDHDDHDHGAKKAERGSNKGAKKAKKTAGHDHDHDHGAEAKAEGANHTAFEGTYELTCASPGKIDQISFDYFSKFGGAEEVEVEIASASGQQKFEVTRGKPVATLAGL